MNVLEQWPRVISQRPNHESRLTQARIMDVGRGAPTLAAPHAKRAAAFSADPRRFDLVLTDETMPDLTGTDLAREIRRLRSDIPIVLMSGFSGERLTERHMPPASATCCANLSSAATSPNRSRALAARR